MESLVYIALFAPLVSSLFSALFAQRPKTYLVGTVASLLIGASLVSSLILLFTLLDNPTPIHIDLMDWIVVGDMDIKFGFTVDPVTVTMMGVVTLVSTVVHVYSNYYMGHDKSYNRFFSYLSAFVFSMLILVMSDNFLGLFIGWEGVGVCSWLLIGFWYHKPDVSKDINPSVSPSWAANEAFIVNRIADLGMLVGIFMIYWSLGTLNYNEVFANLDKLDHTYLVGIGIALFIGAMGKSAQFPLHTWLTDAMEGPTPVSALIHAATMVTAGVYLVVRAHPLYQEIPNVSYFIAVLGTFVAIFAASMALVNRDLKRIIAYSTLSQLGYMFAAAGLGAYWVALFHLAAHAFFKALLFLGAGNVMHGMNDELDIFKMGGLKKYMAKTFFFMGLASLALSGIYPLAGFFSKDTILEVAFNEQTYGIWFVLWFTAGLTAFYSFRQVFLVFLGDERFKKYGIHPHGAPTWVAWTFSPLAIMAVIFGFFKEDAMEFLTHLLPPYEMSEHTEHMVPILIIITTLIAVSGIVIAYIKYAKGLKRDPKIENSFAYKLLYNQYYIPLFYEKAITKPYEQLSNIAWQQIDMKVVDATVDGIAHLVKETGDVSRRAQNGNLSSYLKWMVAGLIMITLIAVIFVVMK